MGRHTCATLVALAFFCVVCAHAVAAPGTINFGVADDAGKYAGDSGAEFYARIAASGLGNDRLTVMWDPASPMAITEQPFLDRTIPEAASLGVNLILSVRPARANAIGGSLVQAKRFAAYRRAARDDVSDGQDVRDRERAESAALLAAAVPERQTGRRARLRTRARALLRRAEEGRSRRSRSSAARSRDAGTTTRTR